MLNYLSKKHDIETFSISPENFTGEKGKAGIGKYGHCCVGSGWYCWHAAT